MKSFKFWLFLTPLTVTLKWLLYIVNLVLAYNKKDAINLEYKVFTIRFINSGLKEQFQS